MPRSPGRSNLATRSKHVDPWVRIAVMLVASGVVLSLAYIFTGSALPSNPKHAVVFQNALLLIVLGSALLEHHYTKPADAVVNSVMGLVTLLSVYEIAPFGAWLSITSYCGAVFILSTTCVAASSGSSVKGWRKTLASWTYKPAVLFGRSRILFSLVFLSGLWFFFGIQDRLTVSLILFWGCFVSIWPLGVPELITSWISRDRGGVPPLGTISRVDHPNLLRITLEADSTWHSSEPAIGVMPNGETRWVQPLFSQFRGENLLATGLLTRLPAETDYTQTSCVYEAGLEPCPSSTEITASLGGGESAELSGFVVERSSVGTIRFEVLGKAAVHVGMLVWLSLGQELVYYQVVEGETLEEFFSPDLHGFQVASATQLGTLEPGKGFSRHSWLPAMNCPVFSSAAGQLPQADAVLPNDFILGTVPNSAIRVGGDFLSQHAQHTAILGVTGSGKTELAFDLIRHSVAGGLKVVCIDLTGQYSERLSDLSPEDLSVDADLAEDLSGRLFDVETGTYGAGAEKKILKEFTESLRTDVAERMTQFLSDDAPGLGLLRLEEISNTKATLLLTEIYMSCLLRHARENLGNKQRVLVVIEEAHTVVPEASTMGLGDYDSRGLVGKISQVALQGRKYGVGLLVLAQRTATVSKTVLTQCNTIISFTCYDDTSLNFLRNIYGADHVALIPNLAPLQAVAAGPWVRSTHPLVFEIPFDEKKREHA